MYSSSELNGREIYFTDNKGEAWIKITSLIVDDGYAAVSPDGERMAVYGKSEKRKTLSIHTVNTYNTNIQRQTHESNV